MPQGTKAQAPQLPIENRTNLPTGSPRRRGGAAGGNDRSNRNVGGLQAKSWADFTPTPWVEHTPTPWSTLHAVPEFGGAFPLGCGHLTNTAGTAQDGTRGAGTRGDGDGAYWPATPTPQATAMMYDFGAQGMNSGLSMQPPPMLAAMAAAAAGAAGAAAAAAACAAAGGEGSSPDSPPEQYNQVSQFSNLVPGQAYPSAMVSQQQASETQQDGAVPTNLPSRGSITHGSGKCRPCAWFWKQQGCQNALECGYCHLCPEGELRSRKKSKVAAMRMGALAPAKPGSNNPGTARTLKLGPLV